MPGENSCYAPRLAEEVGKAALHIPYFSKRERKRDAHDYAYRLELIESVSVARNHRIYIYIYVT